MFNLNARLMGETKTKTVKDVQIMPFNEHDIKIVCYDENVIGDSNEQTIRNYLNLHIQEYPELEKVIDDGVHTTEKCFEYIRKEVQKITKHGCAMIGSDKVFRMAINYYMSPIEERTVIIEEKKPMVENGWNSPQRIKEREEERKRQQEAELAKKRELDIKKNGLSLFDF